jgi:hypothetical protein
MNTKPPKLDTTERQNTGSLVLYITTDLRGPSIRPDEFNSQEEQFR